MISITVKDRQTLVDIAVQQYGSAASMIELCLDNSLEFDADLSPGSVLQIRDVVPNSGTEAVANYIRDNNIVILGISDDTIIDVLGTNNEEFIITNDNDYIGA